MTPGNVRGAGKVFLQTKNGWMIGSRQKQHKYKPIIFVTKPKVHMYAQICVSVHVDKRDRQWSLLTTADGHNS